MINIPTTSFAVVLGLLVIIAARIAYTATHDKDNKFNFSDAFIDINGKTSMGRIGQFVALCVTTWAFVYLIVDGKMSEYYFDGYMGGWVVNALGSKFLDK